MECREAAGLSPMPERASAVRTVAFLNDELTQVDGLSPVAELYEAFVDALERVYRLQESG
jgi:hypothetical protein